MIKKITLVLFTVLFAATFSYAAQQEDKPLTEPSQNVTEPAAPTPDMTQQNTSIAGVIDRIDLEKKTITILNSVTNERHEVTFNDTSSFSKDEKPIKAEDLKKGDKVSLNVDAAHTVVSGTLESKSSSPKPDSPEKENPEKKD